MQIVLGPVLTTRKGGYAFDCWTPEKGIKLRDSLTAMHRRHAEMLSRAAVSADDLQTAGVTLRRLERFWISAADLVQR